MDDFEDDILDPEELRAEVKGVPMELRPRHVKTPEIADYVRFNAFCTSKQEMASHLGISTPTLERHYAEEMKASRAIWINKTLVAADMALAQGNATIINKLLSTVCGLSETSKIEHTGKDGGAIELVSKPPPITREEWMKQYNQNLLTPPELEPELAIEGDEEFDD